MSGLIVNNAEILLVIASTLFTAGIIQFYCLSARLFLVSLVMLVPGVLLWVAVWDVAILPASAQHYVARRDQFMSQCLEDHKGYECDLKWKQLNSWL